MGAKVIWSPNSLSDVHEIVSFIASDNVPAAIRVGQQLLEAIDRLTVFPKLGRPLRDVGRPHLREVVVDNYRVIHRFDEKSNVVTIVRVWHGARGPIEL